MKLWRHDGTLVTTVKGHRSGVRSPAFHPHPPFRISATKFQTIIVWNLVKILEIDPLDDVCTWVRDYSHTNSKAKPLCQQLFPKP